MTVKKGDVVTVHYTGTLDDGTVFDSSEGKDPLKFEVGAGHVIKGFDAGVVGMKVNDEKELKIKPEEAYGTPNEKLHQKVPKDRLPQDREVKEGMMMLVGLQDGRQLPAKVLKVEEKEVTIDLNHPLAGKTLNFKVKLVEIGDKETEEKKTKEATEEKKE